MPTYLRRNGICLFPVAIFFIFQITNDVWMQKLYSNDARLSLEVVTRACNASPAKLQLGQYATEFAALSGWGTSFLLLIILELAASLSAVAIAFLVIRDVSTKVIAIRACVALVAFLVVVLLQKMLVADSVFRTPFTRAIVDAIEDVTSIKYMCEAVTFATLMVPACAFAFACAFSAFLWRQHDRDFRVEELSDRLRYARFLLYLFSIMVVVGTIEMRLLLEWPGSWSTANGKSFRELATVASTVAGVNASAVLLLMCTPVFLILNRRVERAAANCEKCNDHATRLEWIEKNGLGTSFIDIIATAGAIVAPAFSNQVLGAIASSLKEL